MVMGLTQRGGILRRRELIEFACTAFVASPLIARAQQQGKPPSLLLRVDQVIE